MAKTSLVIGGLAGTGSTTVGKILSERLGWEYVYGGGIMRGLAGDAGMTIEEYMHALVDDPKTEKQVDQQLIERTRQGKAVVESRILAWILPPDVEGFTVWFHCELEERVRRVQQRENYPDLAEAKRRILDREQVDAKRYRTLYGVDHTAHGHFDLELDTTSITAPEVVEQVLAAFNKGR